ncbi:TPA: type II secretion system protein [Photobacterium damselae]
MRKESGFTLIELLVTLTIALVASMLVYKFGHARFMRFQQKELIADYIEQIQTESELLINKRIASCKPIEDLTNKNGLFTKGVGDGGFIHGSIISFKALDNTFYGKDAAKRNHHSRTVLSKIVIKVEIDTQYSPNLPYIASSLDGRLLPIKAGNKYRYIQFEYPISSKFILNSESALSPCLLYPTTPNKAANYTS